MRCPACETMLRRAGHGSGANLKVVLEHLLEVLLIDADFSREELVLQPRYAVWLKSMGGSSSQSLSQAFRKAYSVPTFTLLASFSAAGKSNAAQSFAW
jgi:hypothetical protein